MWLHKKQKSFAVIEKFISISAWNKNKLAFPLNIQKIKSLANLQCMK